jgi:hypothetical protein
MVKSVLNIKAGFIIGKESWNSFIIYTRRHNTDASKLLRAFVKDTLKKVEKEN